MQSGGLTGNRQPSINKLLTCRELTLELPDLFGCKISDFRRIEQETEGPSISRGTLQRKNVPSRVLEHVTGHE